MGIVNVTPDSFSDGGVALDPQAAVAGARAMATAGAAICDVGAESTRPGAEPVPEDEEIARIRPVFEALASDRAAVPLSVDTRRASVAALAIDAGAVLVKGVPLARLPLVARHGVGYSPVAGAFGATGLIDPQQSLARPDGDLRLKPDLRALRPLDPGTGWAWAPGLRFGRDGEGYALDQRGFCARQQAALAAAGLSAQLGFEIEWMLGLPEPAGLEQLAM